MGKRLILIDDLLEDIRIFRGLIRKWGLVDYEIVANEELLRPTNFSDEAREEFVHAIESFVHSHLDEKTEAILLDVWFHFSHENAVVEEPLGYEIGKALRRAFPHMPIILLTIKSEPQRIIEAIHFNVDGFISKGDFRSWREPTEFEAELYRAKRKREAVLEEFRLLSGSSLNCAPINDPVILHISDIHYGFGLDFRESYDGMLIPLVRDIRENYNREGIPRPNVVVVSGDLTHKGSVRGYERAHQFLVSLCNELGIEPARERLIMVPGNHDVSHDISKISFSDSDSKGTHSNEFYRYRFAPFKVFYDEFYGGAQVYHLADNSMFSIFDLSRLFGTVIVGLNSAEIIDHMEQNRGFISMDTVQNAINEIKSRFGESKGLLKIAVWHHPHLYKDPGDPSFHDEVLDELAKAGFEMCLHGHIHRPYDRISPRRHGENGMFEFGAGTIAASAERPPDWPRHYELVSFNIMERKGVVHSRQRVGNKWLPLSSFPLNQAKFEFSLREMPE